MDSQNSRRSEMVNSLRSDNETPLDIAIRNKDWDIAILLLENGADPTMGNNNADKYLHEVVFAKEIKLVMLLLAAGSDANAQCPNGIPVLDIAYDLKNYAIAIMLLEYGADPTKGEMNIFKFVLCVKFNLPLAVESFLKSNSVTSIRCDDWNTILGIATNNLAERKGNAAQCCKLLISHGNLENEDWCKPNCLEDPEMSAFWEMCKADLLQMKKHDLGNGVSMSFYVRKKTADQLAALIRRSGFAKCPNEFRHEISELYNVYNDMLMAKIREGVVRQHWLSLFETVIRHSNFEGLSSELVWKLSKYLCNDDIMICETAFFK